MHFTNITKYTEKRN